VCVPACPCLNQPAGATRRCGPLDSTSLRLNTLVSRQPASRDAKVTRTVPCHAVPCRAMPCYAVLCRAVQYHDEESHVGAPPTQTARPLLPFSCQAGLAVCHVSIPGTMHFIRHDD